MEVEISDNAKMFIDQGLVRQLSLTVTFVPLSLKGEVNLRTQHKSSIQRGFTGLQTERSKDISKNSKMSLMLHWIDSSRERRKTYDRLARVAEVLDPRMAASETPFMVSLAFPKLRNWLPSSSITLSSGLP